MYNDPVFIHGVSKTGHAYKCLMMVIAHVSPLNMCASSMGGETGCGIGGTCLQVLIRERDYVTLGSLWS